MSTNLAETDASADANVFGFQSTDIPLTTQLLTSGYEAETLTFLADRPLHTVSMSGLIRENGLVSPYNRGDFYACRNAAGHIEGVALIGHATLIEAHSNIALQAFAYLAQGNPRSHLIRGEQAMIEYFWSYYSKVSGPPRRVCRELLLEQRTSVPPSEPFDNLCPATLAELDSVLQVNAGMIIEESGINPLQTDPAGFRQRTARRIIQGRIWMLIEQGRMIFKTDVMSQTPEVVYLEGVYVNPEERGKGYGLRCLTQLSHHLLRQTKSVCLLVNEQNQSAINFYLRAGYSLQGCYDTVYLQRKIA
jgi:predicted GNAT family acetyltransferase